MKDIISANRPVASASENPRIANENRLFLRLGFLETPLISEEKTRPIPIAAPIRPVAAIPEPIYLAA